MEKEIDTLITLAREGNENAFADLKSMLESKFNESTYITFQIYLTHINSQRHHTLKIHQSDVIHFYSAYM